MDCLRCEAENPRDYPVCSACEPHCHFEHRADCRCLVNSACEARRMQTGQLTKADHHRAVIGGGLVLAKVAQENVMSRETLRRYSIRGANRTEPMASLELDGNQFVVRDRGLAVAALPLSERAEAMTVYEALVSRLMELKQAKSPLSLDLLAIEES